MNLVRTLTLWSVSSVLYTVVVMLSIDTEPLSRDGWKTQLLCYGQGELNQVQTTPCVNACGGIWGFSWCESESFCAVVAKQPFFIYCTRGFSSTGRTSRRTVCVMCNVKMRTEFLHGRLYLTYCVIAVMWNMNSVPCPDKWHSCEVYVWPTPYLRIHCGSVATYPVGAPTFISSQFHQE